MIATTQITTHSPTKWTHNLNPQRTQLNTTLTTKPTTRLYPLPDFIAKRGLSFNVRTYG